MVQVGEIRIKISADTSSFSREMTRAQQQASAAGSGIQSSLAKLNGSTGGLNATSAGFTRLAGSTQQSDEALKIHAADAAQVQGGLTQLGAAQQQATSGMAAGAKATDQSAESLHELGAAQPAVESTAKSISNVGEAAKKTDHEGTPAIDSFAKSMLHGAEAVAAFVATELGLKAFAASLAAQTPVFAAHGATVGTWAERLADAFRVIELAKYPTKATAAGIAAAVAVEKLAEATYAEGGVLQRQSVAAGLNKEEISPAALQGLSVAGGSKRESAYLGLYSTAKSVDLAPSADSSGKQTKDTLQTVLSEQPGFAAAAKSRDLREIAAALSAIADPAKKARAALALFGDDAAKALNLLNERFVENADRARDWGLVYSEETRQNILQFKHDIDSLGDPFVSLRDSIHDSITGIKQDLVGFFAWAYAQARSGASATSVLSAPLLAAQIAASKLGASLPGPDTLGIQSGFRGARTIFSADVRGPGKLNDGSFSLTPQFLQLADEQTKREMQRNLKDNATLQARISGPAAAFGNQMIAGQKATDLAPLNADTDIEAMRGKLTRLQEKRSEIIKEYFQTGSDGKIKFKDDLNNIGRASATAGLTTITGYIEDQTSKIDAAEKAKRDAETAANQAKQAQLIKQGRMAELRADVGGSELTLAAAGKPAEEPTAKAAVESAKVIAELDAVLSRHGQHLSDADKAQIRLLESTKALNLAEADWKNKLALTNAAIMERVRSQLLLTEAIGKGYAAQRTVTIETQLVQTVGPEKYNDPAWMKAHQPQVAELRTNIGVEVDVQHNRQIAEAVDKLGDQIELEKSLSAVQAQGAETIRLVTLAYKLRELTMQGATQAQIKAEIDLGNAQKANTSSANVARIDQETDATNRLTAAQTGGAEAVRAAQLQNRIEQIKRDVPAAQQPAEIQAVTRQSEAQHQQEVTTEALKTGIAYENQLQSIDEQIGALERLKAAQGDSLAIEISLRSLDVDRTRVLSEQSLVLGTARDGMAALFREMATGGRSAAQDIHDAMQDAFEGINSELAKIVSGQKSSWASLFQGISAELTKMALQRIEANIAAKFFPPAAAPGSATVQGAKLPAPPPQHGLKAAVAGIFGSSVPTSSGKRDGNTPATALFVTMGSAVGSSVPEGPAPSASEKSTISEITRTATTPPQKEASTAGFAELGNAYRDTYPSKSSGAIDEARKVSGTLAQSSTVALSSGLGAASTGLGIVGAIRHAHQEQVAKQAVHYSAHQASGVLPAKVGETVHGTKENAGFTLTRTPSGLIERTANATESRSASNALPAAPGETAEGTGDNAGTRLTRLSSGLIQRTEDIAGSVAPSFTDLPSTSSALSALRDASAQASVNSLKSAAEGGFSGSEIKGTKVASQSLQTPPGPSNLKQVLGGVGKGLSTLSSLVSGGGGSSPDANTPTWDPKTNQEVFPNGSKGPVGWTPGGGAQNYASMALGIGGMVFGLLAQVLGKKRDRHLSFASQTPFGDKEWDGFRAEGGPVTAGKMYGGGEKGLEVFVPGSKLSIIGKDGPQLFSPKESGTIIPNHTLSALGLGTAPALTAAVNGGGTHAAALNVALGGGRTSEGLPFGGYRAEGGLVSPSMAYVGGERGIELFSASSNSGAAPSSARPVATGGGDNTPNVFIDARGADPVAVEQRVRQGMDQVHASAVRTAFMAVQERAMRTPAK